VRPIVNEGIDADDRVEELVCERQRPSVCMDRKNAIFDARIPDALEILRGAEPQVGGPNLHAEFAAQEDRRHRPPASEVQDPHAGPQNQRLAKPLGQPQRAGPAADTGENPIGVVFRRAGGLLGDQSTLCLERRTMPAQ